MAKITAVIDIGSNSLTLVIYKKSSRFAFHTIHSSKYKIELGKDSYNSNFMIKEDNLNRAYEILYDFTLTIKSYRTKKTLCIATSAIRESKNSKEFIKKVKTNLGIDIKVISGEKEARLGAIATINLLPYQDEFTTIDIGGGSTELAKVRNSKIIKTLSLKIGHLRLSSIKNKSEYLQKALLDIDQEFFANTVVLIGGTARAVSKYILQKSNYPYNSLHSYEYTDIDQIKELFSMGEDDLLQNAISQSRVKTIKDGARILYSILSHLKAKKVVTSQAGIREGLYLSDLLRSQNLTFPTNYNMSLRSIVDRFVEHPKLAYYRSNIALKLYHTICSDATYKNEIIIASRLIDTPINTKDLSFGHTHQEIYTTKFLLQSLHGDINSNEFSRYSILLPKFKELKQLIFILKLTLLLTKNTLIQRVDISKVDELLQIKIDKISLFNIEQIYKLDKNVKVLNGRKSL
jgi:exopolyphosphatase/guanosine-5'-triphosphate,3'-diphosphate pyrophosphatase